MMGRLKSVCVCVCSEEVHQEEVGSRRRRRLPLNDDLLIYLPLDFSHIPGRPMFLLLLLGLIRGGELVFAVWLKQWGRTLLRGELRVLLEWRDQPRLPP